MQVLQRIAWSGVPVDCGELFVLRKDDWSAMCKLTTHPLGWELRVYINAPENIVSTRICGSEEDVLNTGESWKAKMIAKGWADIAPDISADRRSNRALALVGAACLADLLRTRAFRAAVLRGIPFTGVLSWEYWVSFSRWRARARVR